MTPKKRTTRASPTTTTTTTTPITNAQLKALIDQGVADAFAVRDADRSMNGDESHNSGMGIGDKLLLLLSAELAFMCARMFTKESNKIKKYVGGLPDMIHRSVMVSKPKTMQEAVEFATELMDRKFFTFAKRQTENKRKQDDNQQQENKRHNTGRAYTARPGEKKPYDGSKPLCSKCNYHHDGPCASKFHKCKRVGHLARDYRSPAATNNQRNLTGYECGNQGHYRSDCPELKNKNHGNQAGGTGARGMAHALEGG
nr:hypothetical protein [Tanacetum cinerariifolium]